MRSEQEIKDKLLEIYNSRESFIAKTKKEKYPSKDLQFAFDMAKQVYTEKISILNWILDNDDEQKELPSI